MHLLPTTVVGSYVHLPPRVRARELVEAQDAATLMAIRDMERAGIDIVSDGEIRRRELTAR